MDEQDKDFNFPDENEDETEGMTEEEYLAGEPSDTLPETFLSEEDRAGEINMIMIPNYRMNEELVLKTYLEAVCKCRNKTEILSVLRQLLDQGIEYGAYSERLDRLQEDIEILQIETGLMNGEYRLMTGFEDED